MTIDTPTFIDPKIRITIDDQIKLQCVTHALTIQGQKFTLLDRHSPVLFTLDPVQAGGT